MWLSIFYCIIHFTANKMNIRTDDNSKENKKYGTGINLKVHQKQKVSGKEYTHRKNTTTSWSMFNVSHRKCFHNLKFMKSRRKYSVHYTLPDGSGNVVNVYKRIFMNVLAPGKKTDVLVTKKWSVDISKYSKISLPYYKSHKLNSKRWESLLSWKNSNLYHSTDLNKAFNKLYSRRIHICYINITAEFPKKNFKFWVFVQLERIQRASPSVNLKLELHHRKAE